VLTQLADALAKHVATQRAHFACDPSVMYRCFEDPLKLRLAVGVTYSFTGNQKTPALFNMLQKVPGTI
jgi:hypothetical protein